MIEKPSVPPEAVKQNATTHLADLNSLEFCHVTHLLETLPTLDPDNDFHS